jgi:hypothetical protein
MLLVAEWTLLAVGKLLNLFLWIQNIFYAKIASNIDEEKCLG